MKFPNFFLLFLLLTGAVAQADVQLIRTQDDTVMARECLTPPVIDGRGDEACWAAAHWQTIDQIWIPWGGTMDPADFTGRYKVIWSSATDRIYFLVEIVDDVLVDGYRFPQDGYYNWDVVELFFDEDASGGDHTLNQNAFAYHITAGNADVDYEVMDLTANYAVKNYSHHLDCKIESADGVYLWEIGLIVYNEDYNPNSSTNPTEQLEIGKVSGLSIAYCDNDNPDENPKSRDNFIGSVAVSASRNNSHWQDASDFGTLKLVAADHGVGVAASPVAPTCHLLVRNFPNPFNPATTISYQLPAAADVQLDIYSARGLKVRSLVDGVVPAGEHQLLWDGMNDAGENVASGIYLCRLSASTAQAELRQTHKMILTR